MFDFGNANDGQKLAISTSDGPVLITAGPGDGGIIMTSQAKTA